jgi:hypothetical protein
LISSQASADHVIAVGANGVLALPAGDVVGLLAVFPTPDRVVTVATGDLVLSSAPIELAVLSPAVETAGAVRIVLLGFARTSGGMSATRALGVTGAGARTEP